MYEITELRCKNCGGTLNIDEAQDGVIRCKYCKSLFAVHKKETSPEAVTQLKIADNELENNAFDRALTAYKRAAEIDGGEPQAYYGMALARHKVQYLKAVKDENGERVSYLQPICYEYEGKRFTEDESYIRALELASDSQREYYKSRGAEIEYIAREFERLSSSGLDYDSFICVKVTDDRTGLKTSDCKDADDIYYYLKRKGYKPFFSETEIGSKSGADYEAHILYALYRAECMIVVCHDERYLETPWVRNEYTRFLNLIRSEQKESDAVTIAFSGRAIERLPGRSGRLQGIDLRRGDSFEKIREYVDSHTPEARARRAEESARKARESEQVKQETEELKRQLEQQQRRFEEQLKELAKAKAAEPAKSVDVSGLSGEEMLALMERAQRERDERARRERERLQAEERARHEAQVAAERARREEEERKKKADEERKRQEREAQVAEERAKKQEEEVKKFAHKYYIISDGVLESYNGKNKIERDSFGNSVRDATFPIPSSVEKIGAQAFYTYDGYEEIDRINILGNVKEIGYGAFQRCRYLKYINIPDSIEVIEPDAFKECKIKYNSPENDVNYLGNKNNPYVILMGIKNRDLTSYVVHKDTRIINCDAFKDCTSLTDIVISDNVTRINSNAFKNCSGLKSVKIPESVQYIGNGAFENCESLKDIYIPSSVTCLAVGAFRGCLPETVTVSPSNPKYEYNGGAIVDKDTGEVIAAFNPDKVIAKTDVIEKDTFSGSLLTEVVIPDGVETIGENAFKGSKKLTKVTIPDSVSVIERGAFSGCISLQSINLPNGLEIIEENAFGGDLRLTNITIPSSVKQIGRGAFNNCTSLKSMVIPDSVESLDGWDTECVISIGTFEGCTSLTDVRLPKTLTEIPCRMFKNCTSLKSVVIPDGVESLGAYAFCGCESLENINLPIGLKSIDDGCFAECNSLKSLTVPGGVERMGTVMLTGCKSLESLSLPFIGKDIETPSELGYFFGKKEVYGLEAYDFPNTLKSLYVESGAIVEEVFRGLRSYNGDSEIKNSEATAVIENLTLGSDVVEIKRFAFAHARSLKQVKLPKALKKQVQAACIYRYETYDAFGKRKSVKVDERKHIKFIFT